MGTRLKQVEAKLIEELVFPTFSLYFVNKQGWSGINKDSGNKIQWSYLNLFYPMVLEVSLIDFVADNLVDPGIKPSSANASNEPAVALTL